MATEDFKRKLTAILSADVKGYSRLMGEDEEKTGRTYYRLPYGDSQPHPAVQRSGGGLSW